MTLRISLLGTFDVRSGTTALTEFRAQSARTLLAYLALEHNRPHERTLLCHLLWPDTPLDQALTNLRQALHRLRKTLAEIPGGEAALLISRHSVQLNMAAIWTDVGAFRGRLAEVQRHSHRSVSSCPTCVGLLREAAELYRGELLPGVTGTGAMQFEEWLLVWRERLRTQLAETLDGLAAYHELRDEQRAAAEHLRRWIALEPWSEAGHRRLIVALALAGDRMGALRQFERCGAALATEIGAAPSTETQQIVARIRAGQPLRAARPGQEALQNAILAAQAASPFVGCAAKLAEVVRTLHAPACRLLTLVGPGGSGKSRLALQAAAEACHAFADGVAYVPLDTLEGAHMLPGAIAAALGLQPQSALPPEAQLFRALQGRALLLLLDGCEQVDGAADQIARLIAQLPGVTVLATSRAPLRLRAEWRSVVDGLELPTPGDDVAASEAGQLFAAVARRVAPCFAPSANDWRAIGAICRLLDGLPLAIELAASQANRLWPQAMLLALSKDPADLATGLIDVLPRHRSVAASFAASWALLDAEERHLLARLSIFSAQFTAAEAARLGGDGPAFQRLLEASLLTCHASGYALPEVTRQLAARHLLAEECAELQAGHASCVPEPGAGRLRFADTLVV